MEAFMDQVAVESEPGKGTTPEQNRQVSVTAAQETPERSGRCFRHEKRIGVLRRDSGEIRCAEEARLHPSALFELPEDPFVERGERRVGDRKFERAAVHDCRRRARYSATVRRIPSSSVISGRHPSARARDTSSSLRRIPSGAAAGSKLILPRNPAAAVPF